ncbi:sulfatase-like hydrolase/transferase [Bacteroides sp. OttesenSCG-928-D19]|nr:sulfatase-like hydrolase/transferase [Bacteroides sp. OttesenSCG-928-D19]
MSKKGIIFSLFIGCLLFSTTRIVRANSKKTPNIIYIYASDLGKGMLSVYGQQHLTTPNIDALINHGVSFKYAYGGTATAHARASLLTGYHDCHKDKWIIPRGGGYVKDDTTHIFEYESLIDGNILLPENDLYLPQVFQKAGYVTAQIGMLGIGNASSRKQMKQSGWDYYYGYLDLIRSKGYYPPFLFENDQIIMIEGNTRTDCGKSYEPENEIAYKDRWNMDGKKVYAPDLFMHKTIEFLQEFKDTPFFLMFSTPLPHGPVSIPAIHPEVATNESLTQIEKEYASMVKLLDDHIGKIMSELRTLGLEENTIIVFASDNGHDIHYQQEDRIKKPFRNIKTGERFDNSYNKYYSDKAGDVFNGNAGMAGAKYSNLEGGIRIPLTFYWKGNLKNGVCEEVVSHYDFLPTMADFLKVKLQSDKDGISFLPALMKGRKLPKTRYIIVASNEGPAIVTNEKWKLRYHRGLKKYELYNLKNDPEEKYDVILRFPEKAKELEKILLNECKERIENGVIF